MLPNRGRTDYLQMMAKGITSVVIAFNMKLLLLFCVCLNSIYARPQNLAQVVENTFELSDSGGFSYSFSTSNGIRHKAIGEVKNIGTPEEALVVKGSYSYIAPGGIPYEVQYIADDKGFQPVVKIIPSSILRIDSTACATLCGTGLG